MSIIPETDPGKHRKVNDSSSNVRCCVPQFVRIRHTDTKNCEVLEPILYSEDAEPNHGTFEECFETVGWVTPCENQN
jgi:hypothetical protein